VAIGGLLLVLLVLLARRVGWNTVRGLLAGTRPPLLTLGVIALAVGMAARTIRRWWMLRTFDRSLPLARCVRPFLASLTLNNTLPPRAGDMVRVVGLRGTLPASPGRVLGTLVIERVLDLLVLLVISFAAVLGAARVFPRPLMLGAGAAASSGGGGGRLVSPRPCGSSRNP
jgi:uncharacterized membrane protein YbhN (UPF0104 family)